jgi:hypothetical protein
MWIPGLTPGIARFTGGRAALAPRSPAAPSHPVPPRARGHEAGGGVRLRGRGRRICGGGRPNNGGRDAARGPSNSRAQSGVSAKHDGSFCRRTDAVRAWRTGAICLIDKSPSEGAGSHHCSDRPAFVGRR